MMNKILVVEDSPVVLKVLNHLLSQVFSFSTVLSASYQEAEQALEVHGQAPFFAAIVDLNLPDAENGEIVDLVLSLNIPCVVLTGTYDDDLRIELLNKGVLDYITKDSRYSFNRAIQVIERLEKNQKIKALVAEDSSTSRLFVSSLLEQYRFNVTAVKNGQEALSALEADPEIRLLITDHNMPLINGYDLVRMLRQNMRFQDLVIIGLSAEGDNALSAKFIKMGANDFLKKPFYHEEFHCRVVQNLESQEMLETIRDIADLDSLTRLKNRSYLFGQGKAWFDTQAIKPQGVGLAMFDLDSFNAINDTYGFMVGDALLKELGSVFAEFFADDLVVRFDSDAFCVVGSGGDAFESKLSAFSDKLAGLSFTDARLVVTFSVGACMTIDASLEESVRVAQKRLLKAREQGQNTMLLH